MEIIVLLYCLLDDPLNRPTVLPMSAKGSPIGEIRQERKSTQKRPLFPRIPKLFQIGNSWKHAWVVWTHFLSK